MADKHPVRDKVIAGLILAAILSFITFILPGGWGLVFHGLSVFWQWLWKDAAIPIISLIALIILALGFVVLVAFMIFSGLSKADHQIKTFQYTEGDFFGVHWRWRYGHDSIDDLASFCPDCDLQIYPRPTRYSGLPELSPVVYRCDECKRDVYESKYPHSQVEDLVRRKIQQKIREYERKPDAT